ncbi:signal peptidase II [Ligilactobacillus sp. Marseille-Q7487]|uniref:signal peptidase II n=1 Tax=Ligilactobacillus sp. Marseille-Q7487 TaxID=3022128 RepID=UPI0024A9E61E|nr:signal peptidase II [Ligilactobacillus sp. Marseille-Q7487]
MPLYFLLMFAIVLLDQLVKILVVANIPLNTSIPFVPGILSLAHIRNYGAAWSMLIGQRWFFLVISIVALVIMAYMFKKLWHNWPYALGLSLLIGGTVGNLLDRIRLGYVIDMFATDFINFPIFNVADSALTIGVIIILIAMLKEDIK